MTPVGFQNFNGVRAGRTPVRGSTLQAVVGFGFRVFLGSVKEC